MEERRRSFSERGGSGLSVHPLDLLGEELLDELPVRDAAAAIAVKELEKLDDAGPSEAQLHGLHHSAELLEVELPVEVVAEDLEEPRDVLRLVPPLVQLLACPLDQQQPI